MAPGINNLSNIIEVLPPEVASNLDFLIKIGQAIGGLIIIYLIFLIIRSIINIIKAKKIREIHKKVLKIDEKLNILLEKNNKTRKKIKKKKIKKK